MLTSSVALKLALVYFVHIYEPSQPAFICSTLTMETQEQSVKYVQS